MIFNSIEFLIFFVSFFLVYWLILKNNVKLQNIFLLVASYIFYGWSDWKLLSILIVVSGINYILGIKIATTKSEKHKKTYLNIGIAFGVLTLLYFKYFNFFIISIKGLFVSFGLNLNLQTLNIIIPLGISFFTFRAISYLLDVDKGKIKPVKDAIVFFNYMSFFPTLLAGPIDKARDFVPQLEKPREFVYSEVVDGMRQILWGLFKKVVIADTCALIAAKIFENYTTLPAIPLLLGSFLFTIQMYADFSGYSDIAIGIGRVMGFNVMKNFNYPFFAQNIADFWRRWHISLTTWLTEYVFTPLSIKFRNLGNLGLILAIVINFVIIGLWHGANWTYLLFGFLHGCFYIPLILTGKLNKKIKLDKNRKLPTLKEFVNMLRTFTLVMLTLIVFNSKTIGDAGQYFSRIFSRSIFDSIGKVMTSFASIQVKANDLLFAGSVVLMLIIMEWIGRNDEFALAKLGLKWRFIFRYILYTFIFLMILFLSGNDQKGFIYFQF